MIPPHLDFRRLKRQIGIEQVLQAHGLLGSFRQRGERLVGPCPLHGGDNPRAFVVSRSNDLWYCFTGCRAGGDVVELVRRLLRLSYSETAHYLASLAESSPMARPSFPPRR